MGTLDVLVHVALNAGESPVGTLVTMTRCCCCWQRCSFSRGGTGRGRALCPSAPHTRRARAAKRTRWSCHRRAQAPPAPCTMDSVTGVVFSVRAALWSCGLKLDCGVDSGAVVGAGGMHAHWQACCRRGVQNLEM